MTTPDDAILIAKYERLRHKAEELDRRAFKLFARSAEIDARLVELEKLLLDDYTYRGDTPPGSMPRRR